MGDCNDMICKCKLRELFITENEHYHFEGSFASDFLQLQINRSDYYSYAADSYVYKLLRKFDFWLKLTVWFLENTYMDCSYVLWHSYLANDSRYSSITAEVFRIIPW